MKKQTKLISIISAVLFLTVCFSGCTTPGTDFDIVKVVATVTRNGGDYTLAPTGESGYSMHVVIGTLSIEALGMDINSQKIHDLYKASSINEKQYYKNINGGGTWGKLKGWWQRNIGGDATIQFNSIEDLQSSTSTGQLFGFSLPDITEIGTINYLGSPMEELSLSNGTYKIPDYGLGIYSATIPAELFPDSNPEAGYLVLNDPDNHKFNGITVYVDGKEDRRNTAFVVYDGSYKVVVLTNEPAFMKTDAIRKITVSLQLIKVDVAKLSETTCNNADDYYTAYGFGMRTQLQSGTTDLLSNIETAVESAITSTLNAIPGSSIIKSFDAISSAFSAPSETISSSLDKTFFMEDLKTLYAKRTTVFAASWSKFKAQVTGLHYFFDNRGVNLDDGITEKEWETIEYAYFGHSNTILWWVHYDAIFSYDDRMSIIHQMQTDATNYMNANGLDSFYNMWKAAGNIVSFSGPVFSMQIVDDSFLGIFDAKTMAAIRSMLDLDWDDVVPPLTSEDLDNFRDDLISDIDVTIRQLIPDYISQGMIDIQTNLTELNDKINQMNSVIIEMQQQMKDLQNYLKTLIPSTPQVTIFAYQIPSPVFTEIVGKKTNFLQADPTSVFSAACSVSIGDPTNWTLVTDYPRAVIITESHGTLYVPLDQDAYTGSWVLRQDMIGLENLTVGDTVRTYFEATVTNGSATITSKTNVYYTRIVRSWLADEFDRLGLTIDNLTATNDELQQALDWLTNHGSPFDGGNESQMDSFYATLEVTDKKGNALYVLTPKKNFKMSSTDSEVLTWEVSIYQSKPYTVSITLGNSTNDIIVRYTEDINNDAASHWYNPLTWGTRVRNFFTKYV